MLYGFCGSSYGEPQNYNLQTNYNPTNYNPRKEQGWEGLARKYMFKREIRSF